MFDYSTFDAGTFDFLPSVGVVPPTPSPVPQQVVGLDGAFGSALVTRFTLSAADYNYVTGQATAIVLEAGVELDPTQAVTFILTKPDGTTFTIAGYVGLGPAATDKGVFPDQTYGVCILEASQVDQAGLWTAAMANGIFTSAVEPFMVMNDSIS